MLVRIGEVLINPAAVAWCQRLSNGDVEVHMNVGEVQRVGGAMFGGEPAATLQSHPTLTFSAGADAERLFAELAAAR